MNSGLWKLVVLLVMGLSVDRASSKDIFVAQTARGSDSGIDASNAHAVSWFNNGANWGSGAGAITVGDTIHLVGNITSAITTQGDGAQGSPIIIHGESGSTFKAGVLPSSGVINVGNNYITVENIWIECTANGNGLANTITMAGIVVQADYVTVQNCTITNLFQRQVGSSDGTSGGAGISFFNSSHVVARNNFIYQGGDKGITLGRSAATLSDWQIYSNTIYGANHAIQGYDGSDGVVSGVYVYANRIDGTYLWDGGGTVPTDYHHNGIYMWAENSGSAMSDVFVFNNVIGPKMSSGGQASAEIFFSCSGTLGAISNLWIYNNALYEANPYHTMDGLIFVWGPQKARVFNNSLYCDSVGDGIRVSSGSDIRILNNIISLPVMGPIFDDGTTAISVCDSNLFFGNTNVYWGSGWINYGLWRGRGYDAHSILGDPKFGAPTSGNLFLQSGSPVISRGANLSTYFTTDLTGTLRPTTGPWDIGAFQFRATNSLSISVTPTNQDFGAVAIGATLDRALVMRNVGSGAITGSVSTIAPYSIVSGGGYNLSAGQTQSVTVRYSPTSVGTSIQYVTFSGNAPASAMVSGTGYPTGFVVAPSSQNFNSVIVGASVDLPFTIQNFGPGDVSGSASVPAPFSIINGGTYTLTNGQAQNLVVRYSPTSAGSNYQTISFGSSSNTVASVMGIGVSMPIAGVDELQSGSGSITTPFTLTNGYLFQDVLTADPTVGGRVAFTFMVTNAGSYVIKAIVNGADGGANSFFVNLDAEPQDPTMIWDFPETSGFESRLVSWRGTGTDLDDEFVPMIFDLSLGQHVLIIRGREANAQLRTITLVKRLDPPRGLRILSIGP